MAKNVKDYNYSEKDSALLEYYFKLKKIKLKIITKTGKQIAKERHDYMVDFFKRFEKEINGLL